MSRFMLNLRQVCPGSDASCFVPTFSSSMIGNLGPEATDIIVTRNDAVADATQEATDSVEDDPICAHANNILSHSNAMSNV